MSANYQSSAEASAYRKISIRILPLIALGYGIAYIDRVNISFAALQMNRDLNFSAAVYGLGAGLFFLGYSVCEIPSNLLLYRFGARRWLARIMVTWGTIAMAMLFVRTPLQFYTARFALGIAEAGFFPGVIFYVSSWFPPEMRARSIARFYIAWPLSVVVMGLVAGALMALDGRLGLKGWQWLFAVEGFPAIVLGLVFWFMLPDTVKEARWLTDAEQQSLQSRFNEASSRQPEHSIGVVLKDRRVWLLGIFNFFMLGSSYAYSFSAPLMVRDLTGLSIARTGFLIAAMYFCGAIAMFYNGILCDRGKDAYIYVIPGCILMSLGFITSSASSNPSVALTGLLIVIIGHMSMQGAYWAVATRFFRGRAAAAGIAFINMVGILGGFVGPYWMGIARDLTGDYRHGLLTMAVPMLSAAGIMYYLRLRDQRQSAIAPATASQFTGK